MQQQSEASGVRGSRWRGNRKQGRWLGLWSWFAGQNGGQSGRGRGFRDGRDWCSNLRQWHFHSLLLSLRRTSGSHGWQANFWQRHFHSLLLTLRWTSGLPRLASQLLATVFPFVAADFEADKRLPRLVGQLLATAFPFVAAVVGPHLGGLSEGLAERGSQSH